MRYKILSILKENNQIFTSGEEISKTFNLSRTAIWKHIQELKKEGYEIFSVPKKGYQIQKSPDVLTEEEVSRYLKTTDFARDYCYYVSLGSTNTIAKQIAESSNAPEGTVIVAEEQTEGKGRMGRQWVSLKNKGIYMSIITRPKIPINRAPQITLMLATVVARFISNHYHVPAKIKWPNDILIHQKKVCGILVEMSSDLDSIHYAILGIGINLNQTAGELNMIENQHYMPTSIRNETDIVVNRRVCFANLLLELERAYQAFIENGFTAFKDLWEEYAYSIGKEITVHTHSSIIQGTLLGITDQGALSLVGKDGETQVIYSGEIVL